MKRFSVVLFLMVATLGTAALGAGAQTDAATGVVVDVVKVHGVIDGSMGDYVRRAVAASEESGSIVVLQIDSRGAYGEEAVRLGEAVRAARVPVIAWVGPTRARAEGGALFVVYSSALSAMAPGAGIGPARPFDLGTRASNEDRVEVARQAEALRSLAPGSGADAAGVNVLVRGAVLPAGEAVARGAVAEVASDIPDLLGKLDGRVVATAAGEVLIDTRNRPGHPVTVRFHDIGLLPRVLHAVSTPTAVYVLLVLALWSVALEFTQPGFGMAGIGGILALVLAGYGLSVVPVWWPGLALLIGGIGLQALDVVVRRLGPLTAGGTALFAVGSVLAWRGVAPAVDLALWLVVLATVAGALFFGFGMTVALRARERIRTAQVGLVGLVGEARGDLDPEGAVHVKGALWRARSMDGRIPKGARVRVRGIDGLILRVEQEPD